MFTVQFKATHTLLRSSLTMATKSMNTKKNYIEQHRISFTAFSSCAYNFVPKVYVWQYIFGHTTIKNGKWTCSRLQLWTKANWWSQSLDWQSNFWYHLGFFIIEFGGCIWMNSQCQQLLIKQTRLFVWIGIVDVCQWESCKCRLNELPFVSSGRWWQTLLITIQNNVINLIVNPMGM